MNILKRLVTQNWELCIDLIRKFVPKEEFDNYVGKSFDLKTEIKSIPEDDRPEYVETYFGKELWSQILATTCREGAHMDLTGYIVIREDETAEGIINSIPCDHEDILNALDLDEEHVRGLCEEHYINLEDDMDLDRLLEKIHEDHGFEAMCSELIGWDSWEPSMCLKHLDIGEIFTYLIEDVYDEMEHHIPLALIQFEAHCNELYGIDTNPHYLKTKINYLDCYLDDIIHGSREDSQKDSA